MPTQSEVLATGVTSPFVSQFGPLTPIVPWVVHTGFGEE